MPTFSDRILYLRPTASFAISGNDAYENIQWGNETPIPETELLAADAGISALVPMIAAKAQLDAIYKQSIGLILDYIAKKPDAPAALKDMDAAAKIAKAKIP